MNREECENQILEKLNEIKDILKQYDKSEKIYLNLTIIDNDYMTVNNKYYENIESPIHASVMDGGVMHYDN